MQNKLRALRAKDCKNMPKGGWREMRNIRSHPDVARNSADLMSGTSKGLVSCGKAAAQEMMYCLLYSAKDKNK